MPFDFLLSLKAGSVLQACKDDAFQCGVSAGVPGSPESKPLGTNILLLSTFPAGFLPVAPVKIDESAIHLKISVFYA